jgi:hypothetical protein
MHLFPQVWILLCSVGSAQIASLILGEFGISPSLLEVVSEIVRYIWLLLYEHRGSI